MRAEPAATPLVRSTSPYEELYRARRSFILWGQRPGRLLPRLERFADRGRVLDAGCGDGKNALYLEQRGYAVHGVDSSKLALEGLENRFEAAARRPRGHYEHLDVEDLDLSQRYDILVSYGLYHCLPVERRHEIHRSLQATIRRGGVLLFSSLTADLPMPAGHGTEGIDLPERAEIGALFGGWKIEQRELGIIRESHEPMVGPHEHSAIWVIARGTA